MQLLDRLQGAGVGALQDLSHLPTFWLIQHGLNGCIDTRHGIAGAEFAGIVASAYGARTADLTRAMRDATSTISQAHLQDFDWKLQVNAKHIASTKCVHHANTNAEQVMMSSDKMSEIRQPVLSLRMKVGAESAQADTLEVEMTKDELDRVLRSMEAASQAVQRLQN